MTYTFGISPCPNDTFIFDALCNGIVSDDSIQFHFQFEDVETLNQMALDKHPDIVKLSYANYFNVMDDYVMLRSGGAMGYGVGPLLISKQAIHPEKIHASTIAIPGLHTTANFLLQYAFSDITKRVVVPFDAVEDAILNGEADAGVLIHENRFTYANRGLHLIMDLGTYWEQQTGLPIPLGGIAIRRNIPVATAQKIQQLILKSLALSRQQYPVISAFVQSHAQAMDPTVMRQHIDLYVNSFSLDPGNSGIAAVEKMAEIAGHSIHPSLFIEHYGDPF
jgi:1,4-dihydroxy-6-naphthoate synthase